ncbi:AAA family ATPase [Pseudoalteromonas sp. SWXJ133]|uniref:AAA family ATPase n=1 Tax=Pseudoalteromonas sp. SWXJ133 TaxID=2792069 RepID=UPI0018CDA978|nr:AAA family ATPase [Pseudoalteromonas sp. SWXJ133]MBH0022339.1 AAA family ATPase [Pseudoalteromonas sp. SWXJ133]
MSQVKTLPITARRWLSLLLCAITAATITVFLSKIGLVQKAYSSWSAILNANPVLHYSSAFLAGIGIKLLLDKFYISHPKRSIVFSWRYPPVTIAVWLSVAALLVYLFVNAVYRTYFLDDDLLFSSLKYLHITLFSSALFVVFQETKEKAKKLGGKSWFILFTILVTLLLASGYYHTPWSIIITFILLYCFAVILRLLANSEVKKTHNESNSVGVYSGDDFKDLDDFREWFKDDSTIKSKKKLEPDLQVYAKRITERLRNGGDDYEEDLAQHIALCGPYGCGKSSIVAAIASELKKPKQVKLESSDKEKLTVKQQNKINWIHSDISTWGAASGSVAHVVLSNIIDDISQHIDMCAFRALPKHYTEALKSGGSAFQFVSTLLAGPVDIEESFKKLNAVLEETNHKLLITLQDVDRGTGDESEKRLNGIAALLDRLKNRNLSHINFIIAMGNENDVAIEVISKATDYKEDIATLDCFDYLNQYTKLCLENALKPNKYRKIESYKIIGYRGLVKLDEQCKGQRDSLSSELKKLEISTSHIASHINSFRVLKKVLRRVDQAWQPKKLMGEVNFISLMMVVAFREVYPVQYSRYQKLATKGNQLLHRWSDPESLKLKIIEICKSNDGVQDEQLKQYVGHMLSIDWGKSDEANATVNPKFNYLQSVGCTNNAVNYLDRIQREDLSRKEKLYATELSDQILIAKVVELRESVGILEFLDKWFELDDEYRIGVERFFFIPHCGNYKDIEFVKFFESSKLEREKNFKNFSRQCDIESAIAWLVSESLSVKALFGVIDFFFNKFKNDNSIKMSEDQYIFIALINDELNLHKISEPENIMIFFRELNKVENEKAHMFFCLFLISATKEGGRDYDCANKCFEFDISNIRVADQKLNVLLGIDSNKSLAISVDAGIEFDNAERLNKEIKDIFK